MMLPPALNRGGCALDLVPGFQHPDVGHGDGRVELKLGPWAGVVPPIPAGLRWPDLGQNGSCAAGRITWSDDTCPQFSAPTTDWRHDGKSVGRPATAVD